MQTEEKECRAQVEKQAREPIPEGMANALRWYVICGILVWIIITIVLTEMTNSIHIPTIQSMGQLIALVVALSQFVVTAYHIGCGLWVESKVGVVSHSHISSLKSG